VQAGPRHDFLIEFIDRGSIFLTSKVGAMWTGVASAAVGLVLATSGAWAQNQSSSVDKAVITPTENCERANASRPANWQYDCGRWCKSFLYYNKTPVSQPQLPAICNKYMHRQTR
jgi:hypothetical protein